MDHEETSLKRNTLPNKELREVDEQRRSHERIQCKVNVSIRDLISSREIEAESVDISHGGVGIIAPEALKPGDKFELWIHLTDGLSPVHRFGKVVWAEEWAPFGYRGGVRFASLVDIAPHLQSV